MENSKGVWWIYASIHMYNMRGHEWHWYLKDKVWTNPFEYDLDFHHCQGVRTPHIIGQSHNVQNGTSN